MCLCVCVCKGKLSVRRRSTKIRRHFFRDEVVQAKRAQIPAEMSKTNHHPQFAHPHAIICLYTLECILFVSLLEYKLTYRIHTHTTHTPTPTHTDHGSVLFCVFLFRRVEETRAHPLIDISGRYLYMENISCVIHSVDHTQGDEFIVRCADGWGRECALCICFCFSLSV